ncbi:MAG: UDP-N-acetylmuramate:L-alanyl-gamma-D-glutamyl-meso-diaminopimelate ligase [Acidobacteria bacterium]|nr:UDP-N-acetylmuramate:L-alanyl-gamma-D-glutamyl-meso-diaminopimelate ligase [Acidobacteriota bacterium]
MIAPKPGAHIHLIGVAGTAMSALAGLLKARGYRVTGSDAGIYPPISTLLHELGIAVFDGYSAAHLEPRPDLVVIGNALSRGNEEVETVLDGKLSYASMPEALRELFLQDRETVVVAGTHGKTTVTSILAWIFESAGLQPGFLIGGIPLNFSRSFASGSGKYFILEGDEYDTAFFDKGPKFLHYRPDSVLLTSVEFDHADIYADLSAVKTAFKRLVNLVPRRGWMIAKAESETVRECVARAFCTVETFGLEQGEWRASDIRFTGGITNFAVKHRDQPKGHLSMQLSGEHNVLNVLSAAAMAQHYGISWEQITRAIEDFRGVRRRLEVVGEEHGVVVVDDFAHHPTAIRETLRAAVARFPGRRIWALVEPRSNTLRRNVFEKQLVDALALAQHVVIAEVYNKDKLAESERLDPGQVLAGLRQRGIAAEPGGSADQIVSSILPSLELGDAVIVMSNGGFGGIHQKLLRALAGTRATTVAE